MLNLLVSVPDRDPPYAAAIRMTAYTHLREFRGPDEAVKWYRRLITPERAMEEAVGFYQGEHYDLLWSIVGQGAVPEKDEQIHSLKALATLRQALPNDDPRRKNLVDYFSGRQNSLHAALAKFALGLMPEQEFAKALDAPAVRDAGAYFIGTRRASEGRYDEALEWLEAAVEHGGRMTAPSAMAGDVLVKWGGSKMSFDQIAAKKIM
jgi:hypothetical protein